MHVYKAPTALPLSSCAGSDRQLHKATYASEASCRHFLFTTAGSNRQLYTVTHTKMSLSMFIVISVTQKLSMIIFLKAHQYSHTKIKGSIIVSRAKNIF